MEKELNEELTQGSKLAVDLVEHLKNMGAASASIPVFHDGINYKVIIQRVEV
jgi:hypothetical protein